jgi:flavin reductase (DIM6/NTAB) family NADH-FMN oxidoreductase RutF
MEPDRAFLAAMASLAAGVAVVSARDGAGRPVGLTATSVTSLSVAPPALLVSVGHSRRSHAALTAGAGFAVHLLRADQEALAYRFASRADDKFAGLDWAWEDGVPVLADALATVRCVTGARFAHHDHTLVVGEVGGVRLGAGDPLICLRGSLAWRLQDAGPAAVSSR